MAIFFSRFNTIILQKLKIKFLPLKKCPSTGYFTLVQYADDIWKKAALSSLD